MSTFTCTHGRKERLWTWNVIDQSENTKQFQELKAQAKQYSYNSLLTGMQMHICKQKSTLFYSNKFWEKHSKHGVYSAVVRNRNHKITQWWGKPLFWKWTGLHNLVCGSRSNTSSWSQGIQYCGYFQWSWRIYLFLKIVIYCNKISQIQQPLYQLSLYEEKQWRATPVKVYLKVKTLDKRYQKT